MRLLQLQYFLTIADTGSITKAASQLYISQPALTKQMNLLEEELGVKLMKRLPRGVELTQTGITFANDIRKVMDDLDKAVRKASDSANSAKLTILRIGCFDGAVIDDFMPDLYKNLHNIAPDLQIRLTRHSIRENREALQKNDIDLLIELHSSDPYNTAAQSLEDQGLSDNYCEKVFLHRPGALIYSVNSPLARIKDPTPSDFEKEPFLVPNKKEDLYLAAHSIKVLESLGIHNPKTEELDNLMSMITYIKLGLGYGLMAESAARYNPGLIAWPLPDDLDMKTGMDVVAVWKQSSRQVSALMNRLP